MLTGWSQSRTKILIGKGPGTCLCGCMRLCEDVCRLKSSCVSLSLSLCTVCLYGRVRLLFEFVPRSPDLRVSVCVRGRAKWSRVGTGQWVVIVDVCGRLCVLLRTTEPCGCIFVRWVCLPH